MTRASARGFGSRTLALLSAMAMLAAALFLAAPQPAEAACTGTSSWSSGTTWGIEDSRWSSTCDGLDDYYGRVKDILTDQHRVRIRSLPDGNTHFSPLSSGQWENYHYHDSDSWTKFRLERVRVSDGALTAWGTWGVNQGF